MYSICGSGWLNLPVTLANASGLNGTDVQQYEFWNQFYDAMHEKLKPFSCDGTYPSQNTVWGSGIVSSVTNTGSGTLIIGFTDCVGWSTSIVPDGNNRWVS